MIPESQLILKDLPAKTPTWAVGFISVIVAVSVSLVTFYTTARSEVQTYLKEREVRVKDETTLNQKMVESVLNLVQANNQQISTLSASLYAAERANEKNTDEIRQIRDKLGNCERNCQKILNKD